MRQTNKDDFHLFTTSHPYFIELGLGSFTTGTLIDWWYQRDNRGRYLNRAHFNRIATIDDTLGNKNDLKPMLGLNADPEIFWYGWKPNLDVPNAGRFKKQNLYGMNGTQGGSQSDEWSYNGIIQANMSTIGPRLSYLNGINPIAGVTLADDQNSTVVLQQSSWFPQELRDLRPLYSLIQLNREISSVEDYYPASTWDVNDPTTYPGYTRETIFGSWALLSEIKAAKGGQPFVQWSGEVTFYVSENNGLLDQCPITDWVQFKLYLTDEAMKPSTDGPSIAMKSFAFAAPKRDAIGPSPTVDGERGSTDKEDVANYGAGEVDLQWNPVSKKWQSGNVNMFAKLVTNVPAGKVPDLSYLLSCDLREQLENSDNKFSYIPGRGSGMPIRAQNSMPLQWSPNYAKTEADRCSTPENKDKQLITVHNFNPRKAYPSGEEVLLTQIDGLWHVSDLGKGDEIIPEGVNARLDTKWGSFTYLTTSSQFFFRATRVSDGANIQVDPRSAELNLHKRYYNQNVLNFRDRELNGGTDYGPVGSSIPPFINVYPSGGYNFTDPFNTVNFQTWDDHPGWLQTTSFDYLDSTIFGIRGKGSNIDLPSISSTDPTFLAGNTVPVDPVQEFPERNAAFTSAFFGCVFKEGYNGYQRYDTTANRDWIVNSVAFGANPNDYFDTTADNRTHNPFDARDRRGTRTDCNVKCLAHEQADPFTAINAGGGNQWSRGTTKPDANMFVSEKMRNVPADVMLNASPRGTFGSPIKPLNQISRLFTSNNYILSPVIDDVVTAGIWLCRNSDAYSSAFDFPPNTNALMFRPLKLEAYLQFGLPSWTPDPLVYGGEVVPASNLSLDYCQKDIKGFWTEIARTQVSKRFPVSYHVATREYSNTIQNLAGFEQGKSSLGSALKWGAWTKYKPPYNNLHRSNYWETQTQAALQWTQNSLKDLEIDENANWNGAGAFGVIGTNIKAYANTEIQFTTNNLYGMGADNRTIQLKDPSTHEQVRSWGNADVGNYYKRHNVPDLSVRIFQGHPADSTIYDPRYFAVHHFNPGIPYCLDLYRGASISPNDLALVNNYSASGAQAEGGGNNWRPRNYRLEPFQNLRDQNTVLLQRVNYFYPETSGVDIKIPSRYARHTDPSAGVSHVEGANYHPVPIGIGAFVFLDTVYENGWQPKLMDERYWAVDTRRTGKLLPYKYDAVSLGIPIPVGQAVTLIDEAGIVGTPAAPQRANLIIKNRGKNYKVGDGLGNLEYGYILEISATGQGGSVNGLKCIAPGTGIPVNFTAPSGARIGSFSSRIKPSSLTGNGEGFDGYFVCTSLNSRIACDPKPFLLKANNESEVRIASPKTLPSHPLVGSSATVEPAAIVSEVHTVSYLINPALKSKDSSYDIFFHFHNDITMTWLACGGRNFGTPHGNFQNNAESIDQHITVNSITPK